MGNIEKLDLKFFLAKSVFFFLNEKAFKKFKSIICIIRFFLN